MNRNLIRYVLTICFIGFIVLNLAGCANLPLNHLFVKSGSQDSPDLNTFLAHGQWDHSTPFVFPTASEYLLQMD